MGLSTAFGLAGCTNGAEVDADSANAAHPVETNSSTQGIPPSLSSGATAPTPRINEETAVKSCAHMLFHWYPDDSDGAGGFNWRFNLSDVVVTSEGTEWRILYHNFADESIEESLDPGWEVVINGEVQDAYADIWCATNPDETFDLGVVDGVSVYGVTKDDIATSDYTI